MAENFAKYFDEPDRQSLIDFIRQEFNYEILSERLRLLSFISACQASAEFLILKGAIKWALEIDITPAEIYEVLLQSHLFCGYPIALESFFIFNEVLNGLGLTLNHEILAEEWDHSFFKKRGLETGGRIYAANFGLVLKNIEKLSPDLAAGMVNEGYGRIISRPDLDLIARELSIVSILTVSYMPRQLYSHIRGAYNVGASKPQIAAVIRQAGFFIPEDKVENALLILEKSLGNFCHPQ